jgi:hypothetical protein
MARKRLREIKLYLIFRTTLASSIRKSSSVLLLLFLVVTVSACGNVTNTTTLPPTTTTLTISPVITPTTVATPASAVQCLAKNLMLESRGLPPPTAFTYLAVFLINKGSAPCTLQGFPVLKVVNELGQLEPNFVTYKIPRDYYKGAGPNLPAFFGDTPNGLVILRPEQAAVIKFEIRRCDTGHTPGKVEFKLDLSGAGNEVTIPDSEEEHCNDQRRDVGISAFYSAPDDWRSLQMLSPLH